MTKSVETYTFGNSPEFTFEALEAGAPIKYDERTVQRVGMNWDDYDSALHDISGSFRVVTDEQTGKTFEIAVANADATSDTVDAEISTFNSSISNNIGNAIEFALHAASHPDRRRVYIASPGNGGSSHLEAGERKYTRQTGRFTDEHGLPMATMSALARVLRREDLMVSRFATDSAGGAYATALMPALEEGQVTHAYLKSRPGIMAHPLRLLWAARFFVGENLEGRHYVEHTQDPWTMTDERKKFARAVLASIYNEDGKGAWSNLGALKRGGAAKIWSDMEAFSRAGAAADTAFAFKHQPELKLTHHLPRGDRLYGRTIRDGVENYLTQTALLAAGIAGVSLGAAPSEASLEALIMPGTHHDHSQYPTLRQSIETYAFSK